MLSCISDLSLLIDVLLLVMQTRFRFEHDFNLTDAQSVCCMNRAGDTGLYFVQLQLQTVTPMLWSSLRHWVTRAGLVLCGIASACLGFSHFGP